VSDPQNTAFSPELPLSHPLPAAVPPKIKVIAYKRHKYEFEPKFCVDFKKIGVF